MTAGTFLLAAEDTDKASPVGLLIIILLVAVCYFLYRSMSRHLRRVRESFPGEQPEAPGDDPAVPEQAVSVDTSTETERFVPPVRPGYAVTRPGDERSDPEA